MISSSEKEIICSGTLKKSATINDYCFSYGMFIQHLKLLRVTLRQCWETVTELVLLGSLELILTNRVFFGNLLVRLTKSSALSF